MDQVTNAILSAVQLQHKMTGNPIQENFVKQVKRWGAGLFRVVVMGEIKKGKSSFINAFLGVKDLVPVASDIATSTVFKIHYGKEHAYRVFFEPEAGKDSLWITKDELAEYGTETGNPANKKQVSFIEVIHPSPLLKTGIVIYDTPGLGGLYKEHKKITWNYVPRADAVFFVTDSVESPIGLEEIKHLNTVRKITPHLYFVQTKASAVDKEAREARRENNLNILSRAFNTPSKLIPYFVVDSLRKFSADDKTNAKKLERSGYAELMAYFHSNLLVKKHHLLAEKAIKLSRPLLDSISSLVATRKATILSNSADEQASIKKQLEDTQQALTQWQREHMPKLKAEMELGLQKIMQECKLILGHIKPNGIIQQKLEEQITAADSVEKLQEVVESINNKLPEHQSACYLTIKKHTEKRVTEQLKKLEAYHTLAEEVAIVSQLPQQQSNHFDHHALDHVSEKLKQKETKFEKVKQLVGNGVGALSVCKTVLACMVGCATLTISGASLVTAPLTIAIVVFRAKELKQQKLQATKQQVIGAVRQTIANIYSNLATDMSNMFISLKHEYTSTLVSLLNDRTKELGQQCKEMAKLGQLSTAQINEQKLEIAHDEVQLRTIMKTIEPWLPAKA